MIWLALVFAVCVAFSAGFVAGCVWVRGWRPR